MPRSADAIRRRAEKRNRTIAEQRRADAEDWKKQAERAAAATGGETNSKKRQKTIQKPSSLQSDKQSPPSSNGNSTKDANPSVKSAEAHGLKERPIGNTKPDDTCKDSSAVEKQLQSTNSVTPNPLDEPGAWLCSKCGNHNFASRNSCHSKTCDEKRPDGVFVPPRQKKKPVRHDPATSRKHEWGEQADEDKIARNQFLRKQYLETGGDGMTEEDISRAKLLLERDARKKQKKSMKKNKNKGMKVTPGTAVKQ
mmetsp:Transcript_5488/g.8367  ORF Transcript_5488/g.8367 Transcript_5488/m.8367 type:complete len:253 (-) Transcript_5488:235-993(-)|eukprot:CAMPEP_0195291996 /NCGR_PEP_ID=MMETSP0707-20130614/8552_1 /TAXON_ID=33640 /ORGANISM="Asterionellopsis glacialis, Strain CCMP134" /LENGTH=252 /DNA_ID=CAMNT_0040352367 /DNA_START=58 /DNA_END=816 /DNA_ORIENTATION=-